MESLSIMLIFLIHILNVDNTVIFKTFNCFHILSSSRLDRQWIPLHTFFTFGLSLIKRVVLIQFDLVLHLCNKCSSSVASSPHPFTLLSSDSQRKMESLPMAFQSKTKQFFQLFHILVDVGFPYSLGYVEIRLGDYHHALLEQWKTKMPQRASC